NAFDPADEATAAERQIYVFNFIHQNVLEAEFGFKDKEEALGVFHALRQLFRSWNSTEFQSEEFKNIEKEIKEKIHA
ncbi:MAG: V-type ATP synthase subunit A, partial [Candidatus Omnitrophota bacterium]